LPYGEGLFFDRRPEPLFFAQLNCRGDSPLRRMMLCCEMRQMRHWSTTRGPGQQKTRPNSAFSLVELMVAVTILSMLFLIAVPTYQRLQRKAKAAAIVTDLRVFATALQGHAHESGSWPPEAAAGVVPTGMASEEFKYDDWTRPTPIGGQFDWEYNQTHVGVQYRAAIAIVPTSTADYVRDDELLLQIDQLIDDGDLTKGNFILGDGDYPLFVIEK